MNRLQFYIAFTHMRSKLKQTIVATAGVAFGIAVFIFMVSFIVGVGEYTWAVSMSQTPDVRLYNEVSANEVSILQQQYPADVNIVHHVKPKEEMLNLKDGRQAVKQLSQDPRVQAVAASLSTQVFYHLGAVNINGRILGIDVEAEDRLFNLSDKIITGSLEQLSTRPNSLVMGAGLARKLNVSTGDHLTVTTNRGGSFLVTVTGIFKTGLTAIDDEQSYASLNTVQRLLGVPASYITDIKVRLHDNEQAPELAAAWARRFDYSASDWQQDNATLLASERLRSLIVYGVAVTILMVAGFGIFNILTMMIYEKMKDIAILKAMGFSDRDVRWIFLAQALTIGVAGALAGLCFGFLMAWGISKVPYKSDIMISLDHLPVSFDIIYYVTAFCFGLITTTLAGFLPSRKAAKLDPINIIRG
ncbi:ABC transporter permease [Chitinophaga japonensis]|uniref:Lipoprotein-releasing system permease protein n=1 Tax=Chitinophaga japonensis TaxID=104662 RepID=A0A562T6C2_CHIJA|nr:ABC transporter permease [Chitinophaga japonensis]TWI89087.1 lipoprotein-releasing system permease protein [Chitinophaga japonensis]